ncbi:MAG: RHS repeat protein [Oscillospiraceae bacterium]|nr:RHS repeat protein [Oscillospiraceae bacterium]
MVYGDISHSGVLYWLTEGVKNISSERISLDMLTAFSAIILYAAAVYRWFLLEMLSKAVDYPDGNYVSYSYDNACRLTKVSTAFGDTYYEYGQCR